VSFAEWAGRWQETTNLRPNTRALHGYLLRRFLLPAFADTALADLDLMAVRSMNRPGVGGGSDPWRGWSHASPTEVSR
jgi:hypothetical protein